MARAERLHGAHRRAPGSKGRDGGRRTLGFKKSWSEPDYLGIYIKGRIGINRYAFWYNTTMKQKPLIETNPYLRDPEKLRKALITSVASSTAIETGASVESIARMLEETKNTAPLKTTQRSSR
jgi:hypothetical protein